MLQQQAAEGVAHHRTALCDLAGALSIANTKLAAVREALGARSAGQAVAQILRGVDIDSALSQLLDGWCGLMGTVFTLRWPGAVSASMHCPLGHGRHEVGAAESSMPPAMNSGARA